MMSTGSDSGARRPSDARSDQQQQQQQPPTTTAALPPPPPPPSPSIPSFTSAPTTPAPTTPTLAAEATQPPATSSSSSSSPASSTQSDDKVMFTCSCRNVSIFVRPATSSTSSSSNSTSSSTATATTTTPLQIQPLPSQPQPQQPNVSAAPASTSSTAIGDVAKPSAATASATATADVADVSKMISILGWKEPTVFALASSTTQQESLVYSKVVQGWRIHHCVVCQGVISGSSAGWGSYATQVPAVHPVLLTSPHPPTPRSSIPKADSLVIVNTSAMLKGKSSVPDGKHFSNAFKLLVNDLSGYTNIPKEPSIFTSLNPIAPSLTMKDLHEKLNKRLEDYIEEERAIVKQKIRAYKRDQLELLERTKMVADKDMQSLISQLETLSKHALQSAVATPVVPTSTTSPPLTSPPAQHRIAADTSAASPSETNSVFELDEDLRKREEARRALAATLPPPDPAVEKARRAKEMARRQGQNQVPEHVYGSSLPIAIPANLQRRPSKPPKPDFTDKTQQSAMLTDNPVAADSNAAPDLAQSFVVPLSSNRRGASFY
ncbi:hypothetical protein Pelo_6408 [Pelomyxa schiedti]|nr:hypothetical protein Pelo_6408 [Pelomyxa schiedti]